jgi:hypothetical protein
LIDARKGMVQTHAELRKLGEERADFILPSDCPKLHTHEQLHTQQQAAA